jgi:hypothetical protein
MLKHILTMPMSLKDVDRQQSDSLIFLVANNADECGFAFAMDYDEYGVHE